MGVWETEVISGVQGQNMETLENTNGVLTKIDLRWRGHPCPLATPLTPDNHVSVRFQLTPSPEFVMKMMITKMNTITE